MTDPTPGNRAGRRAASRRTRKVAALGSGAVLALGAAGTTATLLSAAPASAATPIVVTSLTDDGTGTTLREAIEQANAAAGEDTITFQTGLTGTITLTSSLPNITDALQIQGPGAAQVTVDGADEWQIFNFYAIDGSAGVDEVSGLTLTHGVAHSTDALGASGGAIVTHHGSADLTIARSVITDNYASNDGGGVQFFSSSGQMTISSTTISGNRAAEGGGGLYADAADSLSVTITNSTISDNTAGSSGGGLYLSGVATTISGSTISGNTAAEGGGVYLYGTTATIEATTISGNTASDEGGGGVTTRDDGTGDTLTIRSSTISNNTAEYYGGGLYLSGSGTTTIQNSTISGNTAGGNGGGIYVAEAGLTLTQVTLTNNTAAAPNNGVAVGGVQVVGVGEIANVGARRAESQAVGGAGKTREEQAKHASRAPGGHDVDAAATGTIDATGTIISGNAGQDVGVYGGAVTVNSDHSILGPVDPNVTVHDLGGTQSNVTDPGLAALADNGGPTLTHALLATSPALNAGPVPVPTFPGNAFDQRGDGFARVVDGTVDVGAFEVQPPPPPAADVVVIVPRFTG